MSATARNVRDRLLAFWPAKLAGTPLAMALFFVAYFWVLRHPVRPPTVMPLTRIDDLLGFQPLALPFYLSLWFYVSLAPALIADRRELVAYAGAAVALGVAGLAIFWAWPTTVPLADIDWSRHPSFAFMKSVDASGNACPSLHVAFAVFSAAWFARLLRTMEAGPLWRAGNWVWCAGILYSTVAVRQHVFLDVVAGAALGAAAAFALFRQLRHAA